MSTTAETENCETRSTPLNQLSDEETDILQECMITIMKMLRIGVLSDDLDFDRELPNVPKLLHLEIPGNTKELVMFAVSQDGHCEIATVVDKTEELPFGPMRVYSSDLPMKVKAQTLYTSNYSITTREPQSTTLQPFDDVGLPSIPKNLDALSSFGRNSCINEPVSYDDGNSNDFDENGDSDMDEELPLSPKVIERPVANIGNNTEAKADERKDDDSVVADMGDEIVEENGTVKFICKICNKTFESIGLLRVHCQQHIDRVTCKKCKMVFPSKEHLLVHRTETKHNYYPCEVCKRKFSKKSALIIHKRTQHKCEYFCDICNRAFVSARSFSIHKQMHISKPSLLGKGPCKVLRYYKCMGCESRFSDVASLHNHQCLRKPSPMESGPSNRPDATASENEQKPALKRKRKTQESSSFGEKRVRVKAEPLKTGITCNLCNRDFITERALRRHQLNHIDFRCKKCGSVLNSEAELEEHSLKPCECYCPHCKKGFKKYRELQRHVVIHQEYRPYECQICHGKFPTQQKLRAHAQIHEEKKNLCHLCSRTFTFRQHLTRHLRAHMRGEPRRMNKTFLYHCSICSSSFHAVANLREHYETKHRLPSFRCIHCQLRLSTYGELQNHFRLVHKGMIINCCRLCGDAFTDKKDCSQHVTEHEAQTCAPIVTTVDETNADDASGKRVSYLFACTVCREMFATHGGLVTHNQIHYLEPPLPCLICNESFESTRALDSHIPEHETDVQLESCPKCGLYVANVQLHMRQHIGKFQCRDCGKCLKTKQGLTIHSFLHTGEKPFRCGDCGAQFNNSGKLISHRRMHMDPNDPAAIGSMAATTPNSRHITSFTCSVCKEKFWRPSAFLLHLYSYQKNPCSVKRHLCIYCQREFTKKSNLTNHLRMHTEEKGLLKKEFSCTKCSRTFGTKAHQIIHTQMHDSSDLICPICSKMFTSVVCLQVHMRTHTGECQSCPVCNKQFAALKYLKKHMSSHTGERYRVKCCLCDAQCPSLRACIKHLKEVHVDVVPGICDGCGYGFVTSHDLEQHVVECHKFKTLEDPTLVLELGGTGVLETSDAVIQICAAAAAAAANSQESGPLAQERMEDEEDDDEEAVDESSLVPAQEAVVQQEVDVVLPNTVQEYNNEQTLIMDIPSSLEAANIPATAFVCAVDENLYYEVVFES